MASNDDSENYQLSSQSSDNLSETAKIEVCPGQKKNEVKLIVNKRKRQQTQTVSSEELLELLSKITATQQCLLKIQNLQTPALGRLINCIAFDQLVELDLSCFELLEELRTDLEFGPMINLKHLNLDKTNLRRLHPSIGRLENLSRLSLSHNSLYDLPVTVRLLRKLLYINITENLFRGLPSALYHLTNLKEIVGLNHNLLEMSDKWSNNNLFITCTSPLASARVEHENVPSLQSMCVLQSVGMNVWKISMPEKHKLTILERAILYDLCEVCMAPVKKITPHQETDGSLFKVCLVKFHNFKNVPIWFFVCSKECQTIFKKQLELLQRTNEKFVDDKKLEEIILKDEHSKPTRLINHSPSTPNNDSFYNKCIIS